MSTHESQFKKLTDVGSVSRGKSKHRPRNDPDLYGGPYPFIQTGDVKRSNFYVTEYSQTYSERGLAQSKLWAPGTLCITIAANIADTAILKISACFPDSIIGFLPKKSASDVKFIKYCLDTYKKELQSISQGTTQDNLSQEKLLSLRFRMPSYGEQQKIAAILSTYDDLIESNQRRIALLENMAEELYREWFVRLRFPGYKKVGFEKGIPEGWNVVRLGDIFKTSSGGTPSRQVAANYNGEIRWVKTGELKELFVLDTEEKISHLGVESSSAKIFPAKTIVMAMYCAMADISILGEEAATNQACCVLLPKKEYFHFSYNYFFAKYALRQMINFAHGAAQQNLSQEIIKRFQVLEPNRELIEEFSKTSTALFSKIELLMKSNAKILETRDVLLPRLISGKLDVESLDIQFPPSMQEAA